MDQNQNEISVKSISPNPPPPPDYREQKKGALEYSLITVLAVIAVLWFLGIFVGAFFSPIISIVFAFPIKGLWKKTELWAILYIWLLIVVMCYFDLMSLAFSGDGFKPNSAHPYLDALLPFVISSITTLIILVLNILVSIKYFKNRKNTT